MEFFGFLLLAAIVWLAIRLRAVERREDQSRRIAELNLEIDAVRKAFLRRIDLLEKEVARLRESGAAYTPEPGTSEPVTAPPAGRPTEVIEQPVVATPVEPGIEQPPTPEPVPPVETPEVPEPVPVGAAGGSFDSPPPSFTPTPPPWEKINWEQWIGVRGAALLGGIVLALAAILFLQYSIEHGLIPPIVRVAIGLVVGAGAIGGSEVLRKRGYVALANALAGAGAIILYASVWAARSLYELIGSGFAFVLMVLITVTCGLLSWRHSAREIAVLGLTGGFATPILISSGSDNPFGLFAYVLMLDAGLLVLARQRGWPILTGLGLVGTLFYQTGWILGRMGDRSWIGLLILGVFSAFFLFAAGWKRRGEEQSEEATGMSRITQFAAVILPFAFALYFAGNSDLGPHLYPTAILMVILCAAAGWLGRAQDFEALPMAASAGSFGVILVWIFAKPMEGWLPWEAAAICFVLALTFHLFVEISARSGDHEGRARFVLLPAVITSFGFLLLLALRPAATTDPSLWPWLSGWIALSALLMRQAKASAGRTLFGAALGVSLGLALFLVNHREYPSFPSIELFLAIAGLACAAFQVSAVRRTNPDERRWADWGAAVSAMLMLGAEVVIAEIPLMPVWLFFASTIVFAWLAVQAATRMAGGKLYLGAMILLALTHTVWTTIGGSPRTDQSAAITAMVFEFAAVVLFTYWPFVAGGRFLSRPWTVYAAALAGPFWFIGLSELYQALFGYSSNGVLPVVLGALSLGAVMLARRMSTTLDPAPRALVWFAAVALSFVALAIPLQLDREWITIGWAVQGFAILALWKRLDHPGLKYFGLSLLAVVFVRLVLNGEVLTYHTGTGLPIVNWLMYTYLVPAAAMLGGGYILQNFEVPRRRQWEAVFYASGKALGSLACSIEAIIVVFAWINLTIFDYFSTGDHLELSFERMAARDLTLSLAWAVYALVLLAVGFKSDSGGLRWVSLAFLMLTIGKVFLHDLGELEDLYRVASLVGLALSLILVSVTYQRFVFRKGSTEGKR